MGFERFKKEMRKKDINELNKEIQERKNELMIFNNPIKRRPMIDKDTGRSQSSYPYKKTKKEIAILNGIVHRRMQGWE